ncbi:hypothetical protein BH11MYX3_BH11MYX3_07930 [soil metagenome]
MSRALLVLLLSAGVVCPTVRLGDAAPRKAAAAKTERAKKLAKAKAERKRLKLRKAAWKDARKSRTPTKKSLARTDNMPRGFSWPPTRQMNEAEKACEAKLDEIGLAWKPAERDGRIVDAITVAADDGSITLGGIKYVSAFRKGPHKVDCQLALALSTFGPQLEELGVTQVTFGSIFRFTNVRVMGKTKNILSRHALGIAMDIVSFTDREGRVALVGKDYKAGDELLLGIESVVNESGLFRLLLTPKNDPISHSDHFHLEVATDYTAPTS